MLNIVICEDNIEHRGSIQEYLEELINKNNYEAEIVLSTANGRGVLQYLKDHDRDITAYFIDIDLDGDIDGLQIAREIREKDLNSYIIFITGHYELSLMTFQYKLRALDYIVKTDFSKVKTQLSDCMRIIFDEYERNLQFIDDKSKAITIKSGDRYFNIFVEDIMFFETSKENGHKIIVHTSKERIEFYGILKDVTQGLENIFYKCHKSYVVNLKNIKYIDRAEQCLETLNGEYCFISRKYMKELLELWDM